MGVPIPGNGCWRAHFYVALVIIAIMGSAVGFGVKYSLSVGAHAEEAIDEVEDRVRYVETQSERLDAKLEMVLLSLDRLTKDLAAYEIKQDVLRELVIAMKAELVQTMMKLHSGGLSDGD
jgi:hypothetical protein